MAATVLLLKAMKLMEQSAAFLPTLSAVHAYCFVCVYHNSLHEKHLALRRCLQTLLFEMATSTRQGWHPHAC